MKKRISKILVVDDDKEIRHMLRQFLIKEGYHVETAENGKSGLQKTFTFLPDIILLDSVMPKMNGQEMCELLKQNQKYKFIYIIMLSEKAGLASEKESIESGADDYLSKPLSLSSLSANIRKGLCMVREKRFTTFDPLTQLYQRQVFEDYLNQEREKIKKHRYFLALILIEPGILQNIQRDIALKTVAQILRKETRKSDLAAHLSEGRFAILLPGTDQKGAELVSERLRHEIERYDLSGAGHITANYGIACSKEPDFDLVKAAEQALFYAKELGCDKIVIRN